MGEKIQKPIIEPDVPLITMTPNQIKWLFGSFVVIITFLVSAIVQFQTLKNDISNITEQRKEQIIEVEKIKTNIINLNIQVAEIRTAIKFTPNLKKDDSK